MKKTTYGTKQIVCKHWYISRRYYDMDKRYWICLDCGYIGMSKPKEQHKATTK